MLREISRLAPALLAAALATGPALAADDPDAGMIVFEGVCDASAVVFTLGEQLLVADDMTDVLHSFRPTGGPAFARHDLYPHTGTPERARGNFSAFEGAARQGDKIYFVTSHARQWQGKNRPNRRRLLALKSKPIGKGELVEPVGIAYTNLRAKLTDAPEMRGVALGSSIMELHRQLPQLAPERLGINIEGLAGGRDGTSLLLGLRNPRRDDLALVVPITNPEHVVLGLADPRFEPPIRIDLGGLGITSLALDRGSGRYYILAGRHDAEGGARLFGWSGESADAPVPLQDIAPADFEAQGLAVAPDGKRLMVLSDDGSRRVPVENRDQCQRKPDEAGTCACNNLADATLKRFRGQWIELPGSEPGSQTKPKAASAKP